MTDRIGRVYEHLQYTPWGETWVEQRRGKDLFPKYQFTGKELDPETNLYYFGARYYDPQTSVWVSVDPAMGQYLPSIGGADNTVPNSGVFNSLNLSAYCYALQNPVINTDPSGDRVLTGWEKAEAEKMFGRTYNFNDAQITSVPDYANVFGWFNNLSFVNGLTANMAKSYDEPAMNESANFASLAVREKAHFMHEMTHVWQNKTGRFSTFQGLLQHIGVGILGFLKAIVTLNWLDIGGVVADMQQQLLYEFDPINVKSFEEYGFEQQATIVEFAYLEKARIENRYKPENVKEAQRMKAAYTIWDEHFKGNKGEKMNNKLQGLGLLCLTYLFCLSLLSGCNEVYRIKVSGDPLSPTFEFDKTSIYSFRVVVNENYEEVWKIKRADENNELLNTDKIIYGEVPAGYTENEKQILKPNVVYNVTLDNGKFNVIYGGTFIILKRNGKNYLKDLKGSIIYDKDQ